MKKAFSFALLLTVFLPQMTFANFSDVPSSHVHSDAITYVKQEGIVNGYADGTFRAESNINRAEFMKIIVEAISGNQGEGPASQCFPDVQTSDWFHSYVCFGKTTGIVGGYPDGTFRPGDNISFVEAAKIIVNAYNYAVVEDAELWYRPFVNVLEEKKSIPQSINTLDKKISRGEMAELIFRLQSNVANKQTATFNLGVSAGAETENSGVNVDGNINVDGEITTGEENETDENSDVLLEDIIQKEDEALCKNSCGDGICQEIVCLGTDCPCAENTLICPEDCSVEQPKEAFDDLFGSFENRNYDASGDVEIVEVDGKMVLRFNADFTIEEGPGLKVFLSDIALPENADQFKTDLGDLKSFEGAQEYVLPEGIDYDISSVTVYCVPYKVFFGTAVVE